MNKTNYLYIFLPFISTFVIQNVSSRLTRVNVGQWHRQGVRYQFVSLHLGIEMKQQITNITHMDINCTGSTSAITVIAPVRDLSYKQEYQQFSVIFKYIFGILKHRINRILSQIDDFGVTSLIVSLFVIRFFSFNLLKICAVTTTNRQKQ